MGLVEYLYIDKKRLDSYFSQISPPTTYDKVPEFTGGWTFTGPKAEAKLARFARPHTDHEMITKLVQHLEKKQYVAFSRAEIMRDYDSAVSHYLNYQENNPDQEFSFTKPFCIETCLAKRVLVPLEDEEVTGHKRMSLWISSKKSSRPTVVPTNEYLDRLCLIEDYSQDTPLGPAFFSGYSAFQHLFMSIAQDPHLPTPTKEVYRSEYRNLDPLTVLKDLGARIGPERRIRTLYRLRGFGQYEEGELVFGYPIFVAAG